MLYSCKRCDIFVLTAVKLLKGHLDLLSLGFGFVKPHLFLFFSFLFLFFFFLIFRERNGERERERHQDVIPLIYAFVGSGRSVSPLLSMLWHVPHY